MSQNTKILRDLKKGKKITPLLALSDYGCFRLAARIYELREKGHAIQTSIIDEKFASYSL